MPIHCDSYSAAVIVEGGQQMQTESGEKNISRAKGRMGAPPARIIVVDDHPLVRVGLVQLISEEPDLEVCGEAHSVLEALKLVEKLQPDLVVVDLSLSDGSGLDLIGQIKAQHKEVKMLVSSMHDESLFAERVLRAGAQGFVSKQEASDQVVHAIRRILSGKIYLSSQMADRMLSFLTHGEQDENTSPIERLSNRELQIFELIGRGLTTRQIAQQLHLSVKTIETHRESVKRKLMLKSNLELIRHAVQWALEHGA
jgi:DNA-binding NarL/FixJ family response regulator